MIGVDWGTTSFRAFRLSRDGTIRDCRQGPRGIMNVQDGRFADTLREEIGPWLALGETHVLLAGMVGSRQGWREVPYLPCPVGPADIAASLVDVPFDWARVKLVPGLSATDRAGVAEVMRGEETEIIGAMHAMHGDGVACLPGTHSKWARVEAGRIVQFETHMTGEIFAALRGHTILGRLMRDSPPDHGAFQQGLERSGDPGGLLHHAFGVRALVLAGLLSDTAASSYLSGILIGHEIRAAMPRGEPVHLIGAPALCSLYARAIDGCGGNPIVQEGNAAARGLAEIGAAATWE